MTTLAEFLLARIEEDEAAASLKLSEIQAIGPGVGYVPPGSSYSPRVLAECKAKRRIVERHKPFSHGRCQACYSLEDQDEWTANLWPCPDLRDIALPYADHPDYREEWRP